jgi:hypothetical protein
VCACACVCMCVRLCVRVCATPRQHRNTSNEGEGLKVSRPPGTFPIYLVLQYTCPYCKSTPQCLCVCKCVCVASDTHTTCAHSQVNLCNREKHYLPGTRWSRRLRPVQVAMIPHPTLSRWLSRPTPCSGTPDDCRDTPDLQCLTQRTATRN